MKSNISRAFLITFNVAGMIYTIIYLFTTDNPFDWSLYITYTSIFGLVCFLVAFIMLVFFNGKNNEPEKKQTNSTDDQLVYEKCKSFYAQGVNDTVGQERADYSRFQERWDEFPYK